MSSHSNSFEYEIFFESSFNVFFSRINLGLHIMSNIKTTMIYTNTSFLSHLVNIEGDEGDESTWLSSTDDDWLDFASFILGLTIFIINL